MATNKVIAALAASWATLMGGCGTLGNQSDHEAMLLPYSKCGPHRVYGGVLTDLEALAKVPAEVKIVPKGDGEVVFSLLESTFGIVFWTIDLPLSAVGDTIMLPFDIRATVARWNQPVDPQSKPSASTNED